MEEKYLVFKNFLAWLKSLFATKAPAGDVGRFDIYAPRERLIYSYHDGEKLVRADPQVLWRKVQEQGPEIAVDSKVSLSASKDAGKAYVNLLGRIRGVFGLKVYDPLTDRGLTEKETEEVLDHFLGYVEQVKKNSSPSPTSAAETSGPCVPSSGEDPPTSNSSDSGSTASGPSTAWPGP